MIKGHFMRRGIRHYSVCRGFIRFDNKADGMSFGGNNNYAFSLEDVLAKDWEWAYPVIKAAKFPKKKRKPKKSKHPGSLMDVL